jgi:hypothetical protein
MMRSSHVPMQVGSSMPKSELQPSAMTKSHGHARASRILV